MNKKLPLSSSGLLMVLAVFLLPLALTHVLTFSMLALLLLAITCFYLTGAAILFPAVISANLLPVSHAALSVFIGGLVCSLFLFVTTSLSALLLILAGISLILLFFFRKKLAIAFTPGLPDVALFISVLLTMLLISSGDLNKQFSAHQLATSCYSIDNYYFTSVVSSLRHGSFFDASFETGSPINYQVLGFIIPSFLACVLGISSHQALWGLGNPFSQYLALLLCYELCYFFIKDKVNRNNYLFTILAVSLPVLMAPLHPLYLVKGVVKNFIFNGLGYLVPAGTITYPVTIAMFLFCFLLFYNIDWKSKKVSADKLLFIIGLSLMVIGKIPLYLSAVLFTGIIVLRRVLIDKERFLSYFWYFLCSFLLTLIWFKVFLGQHAGGRTFFRFGYLTQLFGGWYGRNSTGAGNTLIILCLIPITYLLWLGIRLVGLLTLVKAGKPRLSELFTGMFTAMLGATILAAFLHMEVAGNDGHLLEDKTFDSEQFIRSAFYIATIVATIGMLHLIYATQLKKNYLNTLFVVIACWCCLSFTALVYAARAHKKDCGPIAWYDDNYNLLKTGKYDSGLIAINPSLQYFGSMLAASDYGKYWCAVDAGGYNQSVKNEYRWILFQNLLQTPDIKYLDQMKNEGVKYIIATPVDYDKMVSICAAFPQRIHKEAESKWIFELE